MLCQPMTHKQLESYSILEKYELLASICVGDVLGLCVWLILETWFGDSVTLSGRVDILRLANYKIDGFGFTHNYYIYYC